MAGERVVTSGNFLIDSESRLKAAAAGKHVLCEKPLANNLAEAREMLEAARKAGTIAVVNYNYRRVPAVQLAKNKGAYVIGTGSGRNAWLCGNGSSATESLYQTVTIPSAITSATLSFYLHVDTAVACSAQRP